MRKIKFITILLITIIPAFLFSQTTLQFIPPNPQSFSFINVTNDENINEHLGNAYVKIPLFTYKTNNIYTDINIIYDNSGVKVDDLPNDAGMSWTVDVGGIITRTVYGNVDEKTVYRLNKTNAELMQNLSSDCDADEVIRTACYSPSQIDTERDIFNFRFGNITGSFYFDENFNPIFLKNDFDVKIKNILPTNESDNRKFIGFEIITKEGTKLTFGGSEEFYELTKSELMPTNPSTVYATTSFFLKEIESISGNKIFFSYNNDGLDVQKINELHTSYIYQSGLETGVMPGLTPDLNIKTLTYYTNNKKRISSITNNQNGDIVNFIYAEKTNSDFKKFLSKIEYKINNSLIRKVAFDYLFENSFPPKTIQRYYLTQLNLYNNNVFDKKYIFNYNRPFELPERLSYGQDIYGYYNGQDSNQSMIAGFFGNILPPSDFYPGGIVATFGNRRPDFAYGICGTLKEIIYPTGGKTKFEYEAPKTKAAFKSSVNLPSSIVTYNYNSTENKILENIDFDQSVNFSFTTHSYPANPNHMKCGYFKVIDMVTNQVLVDEYKCLGYTTNTTNGVFNIKKNGKYLVTLSPTKIGEVEFTYFHNEVIDDFGIRLKSVSNDENNIRANYKRFYYSSASLYTANDEDKRPNGNMHITPSINNIALKESHNTIDTNSTLPPQVHSVIYAVHNSTNSSEQYNNKFKNQYRTVTTSLGGDNFENGGYQKSFTLLEDESLIRIQPASAPGSLSPASSSGMGYGSIYNAFGVILNNAYFPSKGNKSSYSGQLNHLLYYKKRNNKIYKYKEVLNSYKFNFLNINPNLFVSKIFDDLTQADCPSGYLQRIANFYFAVYKNYTIDTKLEKEVLIDYIDEVPLITYNNYEDYINNPPNSSNFLYNKLVTINIYEYSSTPHHNQVTKKTTINPDNTTLETEYKYAFENANQLLINKNIIGIPLETTVTKKENANSTGKIISKTEIKYPTSQTEANTKTLGLPVPYEILSKDLQNTNMSTKITYDQYDSKGNLLQYTTKEGIPTCIIWGYNQTQPIAKIEGATYAQISNIAEITTASNTDATQAPGNDEALLLTALDNFRKANSRHKITTYTYDPLIGVRSITPPSGISEYYFYDNANRLQSVKIKNTDGTITTIKEYQYNYKQ